MGIEEELDRARVSRQDVRYGVADLFTWEPEHSFDVLFFSFWLSHVPRSRSSRFWELVSSAFSRQVVYVTSLPAVFTEHNGQIAPHHTQHDGPTVPPRRRDHSCAALAGLLVLVGDHIGELIERNRLARPPDANTLQLVAGYIEIPLLVYPYCQGPGGAVRYLAVAGQTRNIVAIALQNLE